MYDDKYISLQDIQEYNDDDLRGFFLTLKKDESYRDDCTYWMCVMEINRRSEEIFHEQMDVICMGNIFDSDRLIFEKDKKYTLYAVDETMLLYSENFIPYIFNMVDGDAMCVWTRFGPNRSTISVDN